jgi:hypothetical protein
MQSLKRRQMCRQSQDTSHGAAPGVSTVAACCTRSAKKLGELLAYARVKPAVNQVESHPFWRNEKIYEFCKSEVRPAISIGIH